ncbi:hypothetical protein pah_c005o049 [Parachlamydia acanthamoebae str. Hall's coccus]|uniref:Uncharacterized protein n=1 Tax=Parachlamydia acanthamoebae TaxID=83552 RepID=A0A0C1EHY9_9BACT|nr:hypothetical protein pah_c005o049 [Parachlamydia acanthamoebae str. Hall's coccus]KIA76239.1 hypothetical protein DB43_AQ00450 [Parachlamydia acanthamoebae]
MQCDFILFITDKKAIAFPNFIGMTINRKNKLNRKAFTAKNDAINLKHG